MATNCVIRPSPSKETAVAKKHHPMNSLKIDTEAGRLKTIQELAKAIQELASTGMPSTDTLHKLATIHTAWVTAREDIEKL
jgi:hypothetical protein